MFFKTMVIIVYVKIKTELRRTVGIAPDMFVAIRLSQKEVISVDIHSRDGGIIGGFVTDGSVGGFTPAGAIGGFVPDGALGGGFLDGSIGGYVDGSVGGFTDGSIAGG